MRAKAESKAKRIRLDKKLSRKVKRIRLDQKLSSKTKAKPYEVI